MILSKEELGKLVKSARKIKSEKLGSKYTQVMLAKDINKSQSLIGDIESGRTYPTFRVLSKIAGACSVPFSFLGSDDYDENQYDDLAEDDEAEGHMALKSAQITDVKTILDLALAQPGLTLNGEMFSDEMKVALASAIQVGLGFVEQLQRLERENG